jgi:hypothetical protein
MEVSGHVHDLGNVPLGKEFSLAVVQKAGWAPELDALEKRKLLSLLGIEPSHPVRSSSLYCLS